ncbi:MAG: hypothetical protein IID53_12575 [Proteobacteria bacterium]|nr:hypothetical protein [Pseudomonadota bacterium]
MKAHFDGPMPNDDFFQALWQFRHDCIDRYAANLQIKQATIELHFCDNRGNPVSLHNERGIRIDHYTSQGAYHAAADFYEAKAAFDSAQTLEPKITTIDPPPPRDVPFSPL